MRKAFGAIAVAAAMLAAGAAYAQDQQDPDQGTQMNPGSDQGYQPAEPGADQPAAQPEGGDTGMQPIRPSAPDQGDQNQNQDQGQGQCRCPCPVEQQGM